ncbi:hypothetical protein PP7435_CHR2-0126 [Komagataella phaffii CBS 7435]|uniref:PCI domain-containing protein n=2 Tax=Komagataella phaffii TaxID=460519 RepID=C4R2T2_KOMPG|nr:Hypothetical protein PAS_chr2-2_0120 [Komagataella phaffii GS115]AOA62825.1 GQ67_01226T0 [Komagataella phaffii]CAH2447638.1 hypothetical protein BQ9382_C2-0675 [Komagataella phaffii CBS 7435]AOA67488.1 GQ68_00164T0 [Komagataella phaffii GS115]CAY69806.1 Hypothetical protein PAS_chr2-2_0120 [Komagataella phaffii GS115]CCA37823.1 hypothetical protein PP7435_CHR2-0126 [Komagataella phaffii CBS 7435]
MLNIVVDGTIEDSIYEYGVVLDTLLKSKPKYDELFHNVTEAGEELSSKVTETLDSFYLLDDRQFEPIFNLAFHLLTSSNSDIESVLEKTQLVNKIVQIEEKVQQEDSKSRKLIEPTSLVSVLTTVFNSLPENSATRLDLLNAIVGLLERNKLQYLITPTLLDIFYESAKALGTSESSSEVLFNLYRVGNISDVSFVKKVILNFSVDVKHINEFLTDALNNEKLLDLSEYINIEKVSSADSALLDLLKIYTSVDLEAFNKFDFTTVPSVNKSAVLSKLHSLVIAQLASANSTLKFADIASALSVEREAVPDFVINTIYMGSIQARIDQPNELVYINKVNILTAFDLAQWEAVRASLQAWKGCLNEVRSNINSNKKNKFIQQQRDQKERDREEE